MKQYLPYNPLKIKSKTFRFGLILFLISLFTVLILFLSSHKFMSSLSNIFSIELLSTTGYMFLLITSINDDFPEPFGPINITFSEYAIFKSKSLITLKPLL